MLRSPVVRNRQRLSMIALCVMQRPSILNENQTSDLYYCVACTIEHACVRVGDSIQPGPDRCFGKEKPTT